MLFYKKINWKQFFMQDLLVNMSYQVAYHLIKLIKILIKIVVVIIFYLFRNISTKIIVKILKLFKIMRVNL